MRVILRLAIIVVVTSGTSVVALGATPTPPAKRTPATADDIRARAAEISTQRGLLTDKDPNVRVAALEAMINDPNPATQETAYQIAFSSTDEAMRATALRYRLIRRQTFNFDIEDYVSGNQKSIDSLPHHMTYPIQTADEARGLAYINYRAINNPGDIVGRISVAGSDVTLSIPSGVGNIYACTGRFKLEDGGALHGTVTCLYNGLVTFKASAFMQ